MNVLKENLHDWLLLKIDIDWVKSSAEILLKNPNSELCHIQAKDFYDVHVPKLAEWGNSHSINQATFLMQENHQQFIIEMQTGDMIGLKAKNLTFKKCE